MAYNFTQNAYLSSSTPVSTTPLTMCCWARGSSNNNPQVLFEINQGSQTNAFSIRKVNGSNNIFGYVRNAGIATITFNSTGTYTSNEWFHSCLVCESSTSRTIYLNGGNETTNTDSVTPTSILEVWVAYGSQSFIGDIAEAAIWNVVLSKDEIISLYKGFSPSLVKPNNLIYYVPLIRNLSEICGGRIITNNSSATVSDHPRIYGL